MPLATVLIPTHEHLECLPYAVASVRAQTVQDFEILIVGDGLTPERRERALAIAAVDSRIRYFDFPKGERKGERHRHAALQHANGKIVAYLGDDDMWLPHHLETLAALLDDADFGHTVHIGMSQDGSWHIFPADLSNPALRSRMVNEKYNCFDFTFGAHTLAAYQRLPGGWAPPPPDCPWADLYMWRQFLSEPWCRAKSAMIPTALCTRTTLRPHLTDSERAAELAELRRTLPTAEFREKLWRAIVDAFAKSNVKLGVSALPN